MAAVTTRVDNRPDSWHCRGMDTTDRPRTKSLRITREARKPFREPGDYGYEREAAAKRHTTILTVEAATEQLLDAIWAAIDAEWHTTGCADGSDDEYGYHEVFWIVDTDEVDTFKQVYKVAKAKVLA